MLRAVCTMLPFIFGSVPTYLPGLRGSAGHLYTATFLLKYVAKRFLVWSLRMSVLYSSFPPIPAWPGHQLCPGVVLPSSGVGGSKSLLSLPYICMATIICLPLFIQ